MRVSLFVPCFVDQLAPHIAQQTLRILQRVGCSVSYNPDQTCCGQPGFNAGFWEVARPVCEKFLDDFAEAEYVVAPSGSCVGFVRNFYEELFKNSARHNACRQMQRKTYELSEFLVEVLQVSDLGASFPGRAVYHDACGALRECGIRDAPRLLLRNVRGLDLREMEQAEVCCGFGGTFAVKFSDISVAMARYKVEQAEASEADYIISTDYSCLMHLAGYIEKQKKPMHVVHLAEVLASGW